MRTFAILAALAVFGAANAQVFDHDATANLAWSSSLEDLSGGTRSFAPTNTPYSNITTTTGGYINGGAAVYSGTLEGTRYVADMVEYAPAFYGQQVTQWQWSVVNFSQTEAITARMRIRVHADNGSGLPGTYITGFSFTPLTWTANTAYSYFITNPTGFILPTNGKVWVGITFDDSGATATTVAQLNQLGQLLANPPTAGSSQDFMFATTNANIGNVTNPAGAQINFGGNPIANQYTELQAVPEPASMAALGLGVLALVRRRRSKMA